MAGDKTLGELCDDIGKRGLAYDKPNEHKLALALLKDHARSVQSAVDVLKKQDGSKKGGVAWKDLDKAVTTPFSQAKSSGGSASSSGKGLFLVSLIFFILSLGLTFRPHLESIFEERLALSRSPYPNRNSKTGHLFLEPPRVINTQRRVEFQIGKVLKTMGWKVKEGQGNQANGTVIWVKNLDDIDWDRFDPRTQVANRVHNESTMTTKGNLVENLKRHYAKQVALGTADESLSPYKIHPETYLLYRLSECNEFFSKKHNEVWIWKETHNSRGRGITVVPDVDKKLRPIYVDEKTGKCHGGGEGGAFDKRPNSETNLPTGGNLVQKYILNPLLLNKRKCETRAYWLIASTDPWIIFYHEGTVRLNSEEYSPDDFDNPRKHITNVYQQREHPEYNSAKFKDSLKWNYQMLDKYLTEQKLAPPNWIKETLVPNIKRYLRTVFESSRENLVSKPGTFALFGADFIIDADLHLYLTEVQQYPGMSAGGIKKAIIPPMLKEAVDIVLEVSHRKRFGLPLDKLETPKRFEYIVNEAAN